MTKRILIADDMAGFRMLVRWFLQDENFELDEAASGVEALLKCKGMSPPDVVLLDYLMPSMDGVECCRKIKADETIQSIPVIMVINAMRSDQIQRAYAAGCSDYLIKPVGKIDLLTKIRRVLSLDN